jgi:hypothetical protein
MEEKFR